MEGLVDSQDKSSFEDKLQLLLMKWKRTEQGAGFCDWLVQNKVGVLRGTMQHSVREDARLGSPLEPFYINASESVNR